MRLVHTRRGIIMQIQSLSTQNKAAWEWDIAHVLDPQPFIQNAIELGINRVFITASLEQIVRYPIEYDEFIRVCNLNHIWVEALSGDATWGRANGVKYLLDYLYEVFNFNHKYSNRFSAIHLDIEPHTGEGVDWEQDKEKLMRELILNLTVARCLINSHNVAYYDAIRLVSVQPRWIWQVNVDGESCMPKIMEAVDEIAVMNYTRDIGDYIVNASKFLIEASNQGKAVTIGSEFLPEIQDVTMSVIDADLLNSFYEVAFDTCRKDHSFKQFAVHSLTAYKNYVQGGIPC